MQNLNLIRKVAWSFHKTTGLDWDDLFQEAALAYLEGLDTYNPKKGALSTHMWFVMTSHLKNYLKKEKEWQEALCELEEAMDYQSSSDYFWSMIPENIQEQAKVIFEHAPEIDILLVEGVHPLDRENRKQKTQKSARIMIRTILRKAGYDKNDIHGTICQLQMIIK